MYKPARCLLITLFFLFQPGLTSAQSSRADSLFLLIKQHPAEDTVKAKLFLEYGMECLQIAPDSFRKYNDLSYKLSQKLNYRYGIMRGMNLIARDFWVKNQLNDALEYYKKAVAIAEEIRNTEFTGKISTNVGMVFTSLGETDSAKKYLLKSLEITRQSGDEKLLAKVFTSLGSVASIDGDYLQAINYHMQALSLYEKLQSIFDQTIAHINIGNIYNKLKNFHRARIEYSRALKYIDSQESKVMKGSVLLNLGLLYQNVKKDNDSALIFLEQAKDFSIRQKDESLMLSINVNIGNLFYAEEKYDKALSYYLKAYNSPEINSRQYELTAVLVNLGSTYMNLKNLNKAEELLGRGIILAEKGHFTEFQKVACESLASLAEKKGDYKKAYNYLRQATILHDSIFSQDLKDRIMEVSHQFEMEKVAVSNQLLVKENEIKAQVIFKQRLMFAGSIIVILLIIILLLVILKSRKKQNALIKKLDEQNNELQNLNQTKDKFFSIVAHDLRSPFGALMGLLNELDESYEEYDEDSRRNIIRALRKSSLNTYNLLINLLDWSRSQRERIENRAENVNLTEIVEDVFQTLQTRAAMKSHTLRNDTVEGTRIFADPQIMRSLLINLVNNGIKFTPKSGQIRVYAIPDGKSVKVYVEDSGTGIPEQEIPKLFRIDASYQRSGTDKEPGTGLGLIMCKEYVSILGGDISVESVVGKGTTFCFSVPKSDN